MGQVVAHKWAAVDAAINTHHAASIAFLEALVCEPSTVGNEAGAQHVVAAELTRLGFEVREFDVPEQIVERPGSGALHMIPIAATLTAAAGTAGDLRRLRMRTAPCHVFARGCTGLRRH